MLAKGAEQAGLNLDNVLAGMDGLKERAKTLEELAENAVFYVVAPSYSASDNIHTGTQEFIQNINFCEKIVAKLAFFEPKSIENAVRDFCKSNNIKIGDFLQPVRLALTGKKTSPSLFEVISILGGEEVIARLRSYRDFLARQ
jgi:glutamyl-tRNA synthetase